MKLAVQKLYNGFTKTKTALVAAVLVLYVAITLSGGGSLAEMLLFGLCVAAYVVLPGLAAACVFGQKRMPPGYFAPLCLLFGTGIFAAAYCLAVRLGALWLLRFLPLPAFVVLAAWLWRRWKRGPAPDPQALAARFRPLSPASWMLVLLFAALLLFYTFFSVAKNGRPAAVGDVLLNQDLLWNVGNANAFKLAFPPIDIRYTGVRLHYHYLTELLAGALSLVSGIAAYNMVAFYMQPYMLAAMVLCLHRFARLVYKGDTTKSMLFTYSMFLFSCASLWKILPNGWSVFWNSNLTHLVTNINSQTTAIVYLCIFMGLFVHLSRGRYKGSLLQYLVLLAAFFMLCFAKGPLAALVVIAIALALLIGLCNKSTAWQGLAFGAAAVALFMVVYTTMFKSGANDSMLFMPAGTLELGYFGNILGHLWRLNYNYYRIAIPVLWVVQSFLMLPAQFPLYLRSVWIDLRRFTKLAPERYVYHAVAVGGLAAYFLFRHPALSQVYFLFGAIFFINLLAVDGIGYLHWPQKAPAAKAVAPAAVPAAGAAQPTAATTSTSTAPAQKAPSAAAVAFKKAALIFMGCCAAVGVATTGFLYVHFIGSGARQLARNAGLIEKYPYDTVVTPDDELAMLALRDQSAPTAVFATNRIHTGARREGISNLYSAFCERQGYMEGFQYAKTNMGVSEADIVERLAVNEALFSADTPPEEVVRLCREKGIDYLIYSSQMDGSDTQLAGFECIYDSPSVRVYRVPTE